MSKQYRRLNLTDHEAARILWMARLYREGKLADFWSKRAKLRIAAKGATFGGEVAREASIKSMALKAEYGWTGPKDEFERHRIFVNQPVQNSRKLMMAEAQRNKGRTALAKAFDELPDNVSYEQEVAWVRAHPLVFTALDKVTREEEYKPAKLTVRDLLGRSNGPAPSKGAATQLRFALADPIGWHKRLMDGGKKKAAEASGKPGETETDNGHVPDDMDEIKRMLRAAQD